MKKIIVECSHCILGYGYASIIASHILKEKGIDTLCINLLSHKVDFDLQLTSELISPIPIFPEKNSSLYRILNFDHLYSTSSVDVEYSELKNFNISNYKFTRESFASFILKNRGPQIFGLSIKQWGLSMLTESYNEVQRKIMQNYMAGKHNKVGYFNGFSLYYHFMKQQNPNIQLCLSIERVDYEKKIVFTNDSEIRYKKLISTIPINHLFAVCKIKNTLSLKFTGSYFLYFTHSSDIKENKIVYDCDLASCIIRIFTPTSRSIIVQCSIYQKERIKVLVVIKRLHKLIPGLTNPKFERNLYLSMSHPLESITGHENLENIKMLERNCILPFGRFGNWEYSDLHELNWDSIL